MVELVQAMRDGEKETITINTTPQINIPQSHTKNSNPIQSQRPRPKKKRKEKKKSIIIKKGASLMSFGGFIENSTGGGGARIVTDISYRNSNVNNHHNMRSGALAQPRLVSPPLTKSMFNSSPGLSLGLVRQPLSLTQIF
jgi:hypothetical protein